MTNAALSKHRADVLVLYSSVNACVRRSAVGAKPAYEDYRQELRWDFWFHCAYCTISEFEAKGIRFTIDHYLPFDRYPELDAVYTNLMYACDTCNQYKGTAPSENAAKRGLRFLRVDADDPDDHIQLDAKVPLRVEGKTADVGEYTVQRLFLNREPLRRMRDIRSRLVKSSDVMRRGLRALRGQQVQDLPQKVRSYFVEVRDSLTARGVVASDFVDDRLVREANRSELLDPPSSCDRDASARRSYLARVNSPLVPIAKPKAP